jgi:peptide/nickel transport system ATP-binding protein
MQGGATSQSGATNLTQSPLLRIENLQVWLSSRQQTVRAVDGISLQIERGETFALLGESGCGKSMTALSIMQLLPEVALKRASGEILLEGESLLDLSERQMRNVRGGRIAMIFQEPMTSLNPVMTIGEQVGEVLRHHQKLRAKAEQQQAIQLLEDVGLPNPQQRIHDYPHQLSGGMKQRVMIAIALAGEPDLLIADEPTTALDVTIQAQILDLLRQLQLQRGMAILLITHDVGVVAEMADHVGVMYAGQLIESATREQLFTCPAHPYTRRLFDALPDRSKRDQPLTVLHGVVPALTTAFKGCRFESRCDQGWGLCQQIESEWYRASSGQQVRCHQLNPEIKQPIPDQIPAETVSVLSEVAAGGEELLTIEKLKVHFPIHKGFFHRTVGQVKAVDGVDLTIARGKTVALVGESGCGKTTVGKTILRLQESTAGSIRFSGEELTALQGKALHKVRSHLQMIFQDPYSSMNPRMMVGDIIGEGMDALGEITPVNKRSNKSLERSSVEPRQQRIESLLEQVGLSPDMVNRYPHEFSGGQRQRIAIARALAVNPQLIICDEPTSALDVSVQAQILNLLRKLQQQQNLSYLFITHNLSVVSWFAQEVAVMYLGKIVEYGTVEEVMAAPKHPYTQALLSAVPTVDPESQRAVIRLEGDQGSAIDPPSGCPFHPRCPQAASQCGQKVPEQRWVSETHHLSCLLVE